MIFRRAVARLTLAFTGIFLVLFAAFAVGVYVFVSTTFDFDAVQQDGEHVGDAVDAAFAHLRFALVVMYVVALAVAPIVSYAMARIALAPLRRNYEQHERFVDAASHELRTPLGVVMGELEYSLLKNRTGSEYRRSMTAALAAVDGMATLSDQLLALTRGDARDLKGSFERVPLRELVGRAWGSLPSEITADRAFSLSIPEGIEAWGSASLLGHLVGNLLENAAKFTAANGRIDVSAARQGRWTALQVQDSGVGMTREEARRAFERFWRADAARSRAGHGLGLALVEQIARAHGGRVSLASTVGEGTTVSVLLPGPPS